MAKYERILTNRFTGEETLVKSNDPFILRQKIEKQVAKWQREANKRHVANEKAEKADEAIQLTVEAKERLVSYSKILATTLTKNNRIDWNELNDKSAFHAYKQDLAPVKENFFASVPKKSFFEAIFSFLRARREQAEQEAQKKYESAVAAHTNSVAKSLKDYEHTKESFIQAQREHNAKVDATKNAFEQGDKEAVEYYINLVLERSEYPDDIELDHEIRFDAASKTLHVETLLPAFDDFQFVSEVKYVASKNTFQTKPLGKSEAKEVYAEIVYQIAVRTVHEIYEAEYTGNVHQVEFNGFVFGIDPKRGTETRSSVLKLKTDRDNFMQFNLSRVKAEACATGLGGKLEKIAFELSSVKKVA